MLTNTAAILLVGACASYFDIRQRRIPNALSAIGLGAGLVLSLLTGGWHAFVSALAGAGVFGGIMFVFWLMRWSGGGDAKLAFAFGAILGYPLAFAGLVLGTLFGGIFSLGLLVWSFGRRIPALAGYARRFGMAPTLAVAVGKDDVWKYSQPAAVFLSLGALAASMLYLLGGPR